MRTHHPPKHAIFLIPHQLKVYSTFSVIMSTRQRCIFTISEPDHDTICRLGVFRRVYCKCMVYAKKTGMSPPHKPFIKGYFILKKPRYMSFIRKSLSLPRIYVDPVKKHQSSASLSLAFKRQGDFLELGHVEPGSVSSDSTTVGSDSTTTIAAKPPEEKKPPLQTWIKACPSVSTVVAHGIRSFLSSN